MSEQKQSLSYKDAGVDIDAGNALVERIKGVVKKTRRPEVMGGIGGFARTLAKFQQVISQTSIQLPALMVWVLSYV